MTGSALLAIGAAVAIQASPGPLADQRRLDLVQVTVTVPPDVPAERYTPAIARFISDTAALRSCAEAGRLVLSYKGNPLFKGLAGSVTMKRALPLAALPPVLRAQLLDRPVGRATAPFGTRPDLRVLVACSAPYQPAGVPDRRAS